MSCLESAVMHGIENGISQNSMPTGALQERWPSACPEAEFVHSELEKSVITVSNKNY